MFLRCIRYSYFPRQLFLRICYSLFLSINCPFQCSMQKQHFPQVPASPRSDSGGREHREAACLPAALPLVPELGLGEEHLRLVRAVHAPVRPLPGKRSLAGGLQSHYSAELICLMHRTRVPLSQLERRDVSKVGRPEELTRIP